MTVSSRSLIYSSEAAEGFQVEIVVNTATSIDREVAFNLIAGLSVRRETSGRESYFIHVSKPVTWLLE
jgi:hypothetical protein